ncbi:unnamed protein product, partial [Discosporangium mesarthrocarpum]
GAHRGEDSVTVKDGEFKGNSKRIRGAQGARDSGTESGNRRGPPVTREEFEAILSMCRLPFSRQWRLACYSTCMGSGPASKRTLVEFWTAFRRVLEDTSDDCDDLFCSGCWDRLHSRGIRKSHRWTGFTAGAEVCLACRQNPAERKCI